MSININQFTYNGKSSYDDFCLIITETPPFVIAERDVTFSSINGRNGELLTDNHRYKNITKEYKVAALTDEYPLPILIKKIGAWLAASPGYYILYDTYDPNYFYYACYTSKLSFADKIMKLGLATLKFSCKPYKYSFDGQAPIAVTSPQTISNPEDYESKPYIKIFGSGNITLTINDKSYTFSEIDEFICVDSEIMAAYKGTARQDNKIDFIEFPTLAPGTNSITFSGNVDHIEIIPRWCAL